MTYTIRLRYSDTAEYEILIFIIDEKRSYESLRNSPKTYVAGEGPEPSTSGL